MAGGLAIMDGMPDPYQTTRRYSMPIPVENPSNYPVPGSVERHHDGDMPYQYQPAPRPKAWDASVSKLLYIVAAILGGGAALYATFALVVTYFQGGYAITEVLAALAVCWVAIGLILGVPRIMGRIARERGRSSLIWAAASVLLVLASISMFIAV